MFSRQTITKDPISVTPSVFDIMVLLGWYSYPVAINCTPNTPVLDSTAWHVRGTIEITQSNPELLLIPWIAEAVGTLSSNILDLTDSLLLGDAHININIVESGFTTDLIDLAPSWYVREPFKTGFGIPFGKQEHLDLSIAELYVDAEYKSGKEKILPWGQLEYLDKETGGPWDFIPKLDEEVLSGYSEFSDKFAYNISQPYSSPEIKDLEKIIPWGEFLDFFIKEVGYLYSYPETKDRKKIIPWDLFASILDEFMDMEYSYPAIKDVFKTIFIGPNWFPKWCINKYGIAYGEVTFSYDSETDTAYLQYFPNIEFPVNNIPKITGPNQLERLPELSEYRSSYTSGFTFGGRPIANGALDRIDLRGRGGGTVNIKTGYLEYPIYMRDKVDDYAQVCFDGYRTGPQDKYDYDPVYYKVIKPNLRSYYLVMNVVTLKRVSDNVPIPITSMTIGTDMDSWCWTIQANLRRNVDLDLIRPSGGAPIEVEAGINGNVWRFIIESYGDSFSFGKKEYSISGRSPSSQLAEPYVSTESFIQDSLIQAVQLADEAVEYSGFSINWGLTDWLVPANAYSVIDKTPMQQLLTIAQSVGGVVHSEMASTVISLVPWYTYLPWEWGASVVDAVLPTFSSRNTNYQAKPQYSGIYASGQSQGVVCFVKRSGTDGSDHPQMVTDALITATEAGLQRGKRILADSGCRSIETINAPLIDDPGLLTPGMLIDVIDSGSTWRGQVISTSLNAQRPTVTQSLSVLRYHGT